MILVDTSVWIAHMQVPNAWLSGLITRQQVLVHPFVRGELAMGAIGDRDTLLRFLRRMPQSVTAQHEELIDFVRTNKLYGRGIGFVDAHLLLATRMTTGARLWSNDKNLIATAKQFAAAYAIPGTSLAGA